MEYSRRCLYGGEPARVPGLARFAEMNFWRVGGANLFTSLTAFIFPPRPKSCFSEHVFNLKLIHEQTQLESWASPVPYWPRSRLPGLVFSHINAIDWVGPPTRAGSLCRDEFLTCCQPCRRANLFTSLTAFIFPPRPKSCFSEHVFNLKLTDQGPVVRSPDKLSTG